jgi:hypothetical protein
MFMHILNTRGALGTSYMPSFLGRDRLLDILALVWQVAFR